MGLASPACLIADCWDGCGPSNASASRLLSPPTTTGLADCRSSEWISVALLEYARAQALLSQSQVIVDTGAPAAEAAIQMGELHLQFGLLLSRVLQVGISRIRSCTARFGLPRTLWLRGKAGGAIRHCHPQRCRNSIQATHSADLQGMRNTPSAVHERSSTVSMPAGRRWRSCGATS